MKWCTNCGAQLKDEETAKARGNKKKEYINYSRQK